MKLLFFLFFIFSSSVFAANFDNARDDSVSSDGYASVISSAVSMESESEVEVEEECEGKMIYNPSAGIMVYEDDWCD